jgi:hypothetical protein
MSAAMNWAKAELEWDVSNPWQSRRQSEPSGRGRWLTQEEAEQLLQAAARPKRLQRYPLAAGLHPPEPQHIRTLIRTLTPRRMSQADHGRR